MKKGIAFILAVTLGLTMSGCADKKVIEESVKASVVESVLASVSESQSAAETTQKPTQAETTAEVTKTTTVQTTKATETTIDAAARKDSLRGSVITIEAITASVPNSAGGVSVDITIKNQAEAEIKYIYFDVNFENNVGDVVGSEIGGDKTFYLQLTGPVASGDLGGTEKDGTYWDSVIYNPTASSVHVLKIAIEYMDGTSIDLNSSEVLMVMPE